MSTEVTAFNAPPVNILDNCKVSPSDLNHVEVANERVAFFYKRDGLWLAFSWSESAAQIASGWTVATTKIIPE